MENLSINYQRHSNYCLGNVAAGLDSNYASLQPDWFGVYFTAQEVQSLTLSKLLKLCQKVTCLKAD